MRREDQVAVIRTLVSRSGRDVWSVTVFGLEGEGGRPMSDAVFGSLAVER